MVEGHEADTYHLRGILTGIFNRLGDGKSAIKCEPPKWVKNLTRRKIAGTKEEVALARDAFTQFVAQRGAGGAGGQQG